jgi:hypothetical protein
MLIYYVLEGKRQGREGQKAKGKREKERGMGMHGDGGWGHLYRA